MTQQEIFTLLESKFQGVRKDEISKVAAFYALTFGDDGEALKNKISELTDEQVNAFVAESRKLADAEISKAIKTNEANLKTKFDFVEKNKAEEKPQPTPPTPESEHKNPYEDIAEIIAKAVQPLTEKIKSLEAKDIKNGREKQLFDVLSAKKGIPNVFKQSIIDNFNNTQFESDEDFNSFVETTKTNLATFEQELTDNGFKNIGAPAQGGNNQKQEEIPEDVQNFLKHETDNQFAGKPLF